MILKPGRKWNWIYDLLLLVVLVGAAFLRFNGSDWGELQHQHPDEGFLTSVTYDIGLPGTNNDYYPLPTSLSAPWRAPYIKEFPDCTKWGGYFDTSCSPLNPYNRGHAFFAYGTVPVIMTRILAETTNQMGNLKLFGRHLSAIMDLLTIFLIYVIVSRLYDRRVALLSAISSSLAVMQIQQSHFYTTDLFANFFLYLAIFLAVEIVIGKRIVFKNKSDPMDGDSNASQLDYFLQSLNGSDLILSILFGVVYGLAVSSKLNAAPLALVLPLAFVIKYFRNKNENTQPGSISLILLYLTVGGIFAILSFRVFQPYAFDGFGFNPQWLANIKELRAQASPNADLPWSLQWARRSHLFSFENLTNWGLGLPLGTLAWLGFLWMGWRCIKGEWRDHLLLWAWTAGYFVWQSMQYNPTMRYELPIYPSLSLMAGWLLIRMWETRKSPVLAQSKIIVRKLVAILSVVVGLGVFAATTAWALGFSNIYSMDEPRIAASKWIFENIPGPVTLKVQLANGKITQQPLPFAAGYYIQTALPYDSSFVSQVDGNLVEVLLPHVTDSAISGMQTFTLSLASTPFPGQPAVSASVRADFASGDPAQGGSYALKFRQPVQLVSGTTYYLHLETTGGSLLLGGSAVVNETDYDYPLPFRIGSYDGFGGLYRGDLNLQVYWDDNADKLTRFITTLNAADYIFIPTNHQYGQITRIPERYPLTTEYYRDLIGCPAGKDIIWCYRIAEPGNFKGKLGFDLVAVFTDFPTLGPLVINDQSAEEAFTFYDHPKVLIFKKIADYDPAKMEALLSAVDLSNVVHLTPGQADNYKSLMLPPDQLAEQQAGGTWSELFNSRIFYNQQPVFGLIIWYLTIFLLGWLAYPIVRVAFPGLKDRGYPLARTVGLLIWAWLAWMAGSLGLTYSRTMIGVMLLLLAVLGGLLAYRQRDDLLQEIKTRWRYFLLIEAVFLFFFLLDLGIRLGNPDLWHPYKGGERPMDFSYFNAILKSTRFPPYDPWFAGGYINYYYFGYVLVGTPVKLLGIVPSIAYNFILPTLYAMLAVNAFSVGWNLVNVGTSTHEGRWKKLLDRLPFTAGFSAASAMVLLGNLGIVRMLYQGFQRVAAPVEAMSAAGIFQRIVWAAQGFVKTLTGAQLPYITGDWYWYPSRVIPASGDIEPITEFPLFTFIYSDLHAHMIALPLTILVIAWALSVILSRAKWSGKLETAIGVGLGGLIIGSLKPTNTWDYYTYLVIGLLAISYAIWRTPPIQNLWRDIPHYVVQGGKILAAILAFVILSNLLFLPFERSYSQAYGSVDYWQYGHTPIWSYLTQWGVFLFFIISWMLWETRQWLSETPLSKLKILKPYRGLIGTFLFILVAIVILLLATKVVIAWFVLPLAAWSAVLLLKKNMPDVKRVVLFLIGTALVLTLVVELVVLRGDVGRMNTVFKFYLQAWVLFGLSAAAAFGWLLNEIPKWHPNWQSVWYFAAVCLVLCSGLFLVMGGMDKIRDRWVTSAPHTFDSMTYMNYMHYPDFGVDMDLSADYRAIKWMQQNVKGSPVIVEANVPEYRWGTRFTIYTGLPGVLGWNWHQRQQRLVSSNLVFQRVDEIAAFYQTSGLNQAELFLKKYNVRYIVVGQMERAEYREPLTNDAGLHKFEAFNGTLWREVYRDGQTVIYAVN
jgi:YYY domain-containing protein